MFDHQLRSLKDRLLAPLVPPLKKIHPITLTLVSLGVGVGSAGSAALGWTVTALGLWLLNRLLDGLDGLVARATGTQSDLGGFLDLVVDFTVYALLPLGCSLRVGTPLAWAACAVYLAACYLNACGWMTLSALLEKRGRSTPGLTSLEMPRGLMEGFETFLFYTLLLSLPSLTAEFLFAGAGLVLVSFLLRLVWTVKVLQELK